MSSLIHTSHPVLSSSSSHKLTQIQPSSSSSLSPILFILIRIQLIFLLILLNHLLL